MKTFEQIKKRYEELRAERDKYVPRWEEISKYVGIKVRPQRYLYADTEDKSEDLDKYTEDPTACLSVQQSADYLKGIMWGDGEGAFTLLPSDEVLDIADKGELDDWYSYATDNVLAQMNNSNAGLNSAMCAYFYDQQAYGTSGIGCFKNTAYGNGAEDNLLLFKSYGVDTLCVDEGKNGLVNVVFNTTQWRVNRLVSEFCETKDGFDERMFEKMPEKVKKDYKAGAWNNVYMIVHAIVPREDYEPGALGKKGCRYCGYFFEESENRFFYEEDYQEMPVPIARAIKVRGEVYGRASGSMLLSTIRCINAAVSDCMVAMGKMLNPPLGIINGAIFGDDVLDTSENGLTPFNMGTSGGQAPVFPIHDVGDPANIVNWLVPYLNEKVATAFKIDILLDFSANANMTATESLQRFSIRGKSLSGMVMQQKMEMFIPLIKRAVSLCLANDILGVHPNDEEAVLSMTKAGRNERIIPQAVIECIQQGKPWYKIKFNNEVDKLGKTQKVEDLLQLLNVITAMMSLNPQIGQAIEWYQLLNDVSSALGLKHAIMSETEFKQSIEAQATQQAQMMDAQTRMLSSQANRNNAAAYKDVETAYAE